MPNPARPSLAATHREITGKQVSHLRAAGSLPAVIYGHSISSLSVAVDAHEFDLLRRHVGATTLIDLKVDGGRARPALLRHIQPHPLTRRPIHVEFLQVRMSEELTIDVAVVPTGVSPLVAKDGGTLIHGMDHVRVTAMPDHLPQSFEVSVADLNDYADAVHVRDLVVPEGVTILSDPDEILFKVMAARTEQEPVVAAEAVVPTDEEAATESEAGEG
jgi:large subunit ribosomal protein L25